MSSWTVYEHISPSDKVYVGITCQEPKKRWKGGSGYNRRDGHQRKFGNAVQKYGWENIKHNIVAKGLRKEMANFLEQCLIKLYKTMGNSYNITDGGDGGAGTTHTAETRKYLSMIRKGRKEDKKETVRRIGLRIDNYPYIVVAVKPGEIHLFKTAKEAAEKLGVNNRNNISAAIAGKQCLVKGYVFVHWDKNKPIDKEFLFNLYEEKVNNKYSSERRKAS